MLKYFWIFSFNFVFENEELPMKSVRSPEALRDAIIKGTRHLIAVGGMSNFSYPKLLAETGIVAQGAGAGVRRREGLHLSDHGAVRRGGGNAGCEQQDQQREDQRLLSEFLKAH